VPGVPEPGQTPVDIDTPTYRGDVIGAALCLCFALIVYFFVIPAQVYVPRAFVGTANSPAFLPKLICILLAILSAVYLVNSIIAIRREAPQGRARMSDWAIAGGTVAICLAYVGGILALGLTLASAVCVAGTIYFFGERRYVLICAIALILPALLWYFFVKVANILLPEPGLEILGDGGASDIGMTAIVSVVQAAGQIAGLT
jgi:putative tricarboxylic transport membrane protein